MTKIKQVLAGIALGTVVLGSAAVADSDRHDGHRKDGGGDGGPLVAAVRNATRGYRNVRVAERAGYQSLQRCVSGAANEGAMGIHYANRTNLTDGSALDVAQPEVLMYEQRNGRRRLLGAEYIVFADEWDAAHGDGTPPSLMGQLFHYIGKPNRYRLDPVYILHVWAWQDNPSGAFSNWNPWVSCDEFSAP